MTYLPISNLERHAHSLNVLPWDQLIETVAFAFSIMGVVASVSSTFSFPLVSGKLLIRGTILFVFGEDGLYACIL